MAEECTSCWKGCTLCMVILLYAQWWSSVEMQWRTKQIPPKCYRLPHIFFKVNFGPQPPCATQREGKITEDASAEFAVATADLDPSLCPPWTP